MSFLWSRASVLVVGLALLVWARSSQAAPCGRPDVDVTFPPTDAASVPSNAQLSAHYASPALYDDEPVTLTDAAGNAVPLTVMFDDADSMLRASPDQPLSDGSHQIVWPGLRGVGGGGVGRGSTTSFFVQGVVDAAPPSFAGLTGIDWDLARDRDPCLDKLDDRFVFRLTAGAASDDAGADLLSLLVFQTRDPSAPEQTEPSRVAVRAFPQGGVVEVRRPATNAGQTCFAAVAQDLEGNVSGGGEREVCIKTKKPPFFEGCALVGAGVHAPVAGSGYALWLLGLGLLRRGRSARARQSRAV